VYLVDSSRPEDRASRSLNIGPAAAACSTPTAIVGAGATYDANGAMVSDLGRTMSVATAKAGRESVTKGGVTTTHA